MEAEVFSVSSESLQMISLLYSVTKARFLRNNVATALAVAKSLLFNEAILNVGLKGLFTVIIETLCKIINLNACVHVSMSFFHIYLLLTQRDWRYLLASNIIVLE